MGSHASDLLNPQSSLIVVMALAIVGLCIVAFVLLSGKSQEPFGFDELYGLLN
jgi:hypothetical protein